MKHSFSILPVMVGLAMACSSADRTEVETPDVPRAQLIDSVQWNGETLSFYDATSDEGPEVVMSLLAPDREPELLLALERQLGRSPSGAEVWLAAGGSMEDVPAELLAAHEAQAEAEGRDGSLERIELDVPKLLEKSFGQSEFNGMFPNTSDSTGVLPGAGSTCWNALMTQVPLNHGLKRVCSHNGNAVVNWVGFLNCDPVLNVDKTLRTGMNTFIGPTVSGLHCFATGNEAERCLGPVDVPPANFFATSFFKSGSKHRLGTGAAAKFATGTDTTVLLGSAELQNPGVPAFQSTTCTAH